MDDLTIPSAPDLNEINLRRCEAGAVGDVSMKQDNDVIVWSRAQAVALHAWLGEYIEETKPKLPTAGESVVRARVPNGDTISLIFNAVSRCWRSSTGADYDSSELRDWTLIFDAATEGKSR